MNNEAGIDSTASKGCILLMDAINRLATLHTALRPSLLGHLLHSQRDRLGRVPSWTRDQTADRIRR